MGQALGSNSISKSISLFDGNPGISSEDIRKLFDYRNILRLHILTKQRVTMHPSLNSFPVESTNIKEPFLLPFVPQMVTFFPFYLLRSPFAFNSLLWLPALTASPFLGLYQIIIDLIV